MADQPPPAPVELVVTYIKGAEKGSIFINIIHVKNLHWLREALDAFNKDADTEGTPWAPSTASYYTIVNEDTMLSDNTSALKDWLLRFGEGLDYGLSKKDGYYIGAGYATIAIPPGKPCKEHPCQKVIHFSILFNGQEVGRMIMGSSDQFRAGFPDRLNWLKCYNCHKKGYECRNCPHNNEAQGNGAPSKTRAVPAESKKTNKPTQFLAGAHSTHHSSATTDEKILDVHTLDVVQPLTTGAPVSHSDELGTPSDPQDNTIMG
ncbi:hypothetical protein [Parasitella parasitica]|uniref:CCHC-type domain-containing protein n=1 Tax=Parasitella parasitica TaxID=35722 RepID=A0A0B7N7E9_9FUNG|nr:hypothetical protein [Parasitella parasitica]